MDVTPVGTPDAAVARSPEMLPYILTPAFDVNTGPVVVLMSGWPDQPTFLYASLMRRLAAEGYRIAIVELPGFAPVTERPLPPRWWGMEIPEVVTRYAATVRAIQVAAAAGGRSEASAAIPTASLAPVIFITHDWGAGITWGLLAEYPRLARAVAAADVGDGGGTSAAHSLFCAVYMTILAAAFVLGGPFGDAITRGMASLLGAPHPKTAAARMNSLYYWMVRGQVVEAWKRLCGRPAGKFELRRGVLPACPTLYLYGVQKGVLQYHSPEWLINLAARPDCHVVPLNDFHWLMSGRKASEYEAAVLSWLATTIGQRKESTMTKEVSLAGAAAAVSAAPVLATGAPGGASKKEL